MLKHKTGDVKSRLSKHILADGMPIDLDLERSSGAKIFDKNIGKEYLDLFTCFASMPIGFNHPKMTNTAFISKIGKVALNKPSNSDLYSEEFASFVESFFQIAVPDHFKYSFFISGGALAVENALKASFDWKVRKNQQKGIENKGQKIIYFKEAFHGRSGYTMTLTNTNPDKVMYFPKFDWIKADNPKIKFPLVDIDELMERETLCIEQIQNAFANYKNEIAAIIIEPIQGEGGDNHFRSEFLKKLKKICLENEALLIFDEVQTGVGITGTWWAHQQLGVEPDILAFGKKMQTCGILAGERIDEVEGNVFHKSSRINSTWGGNLVDMVRSEKYLQIIEEEKLLDNASKMGEYLLSKLKKLEEQFPEKISNIRGRGLFAAFDIQPELRKAFLDRTFENHLLILPCGERSIRFRPPLNINKDELDLGFEIIQNCL
jgi:L-lysine 6-transaminase